MRVFLVGDEVSRGAVKTILEAQAFEVTGVVYPDWEKVPGLNASRPMSTEEYLGVLGSPEMVRAHKETMSELSAAVAVVVVVGAPRVASAGAFEMGWAIAKQRPVCAFFAAHSYPPAVETGLLAADFLAQDVDSLLSWLENERTVDREYTEGVKKARHSAAVESLLRTHGGGDLT